MGEPHSPSGCLVKYIIFILLHIVKSFNEKPPSVTSTERFHINTTQADARYNITLDKSYYIIKTSALQVGDFLYPKISCDVAGI